ncbi:hypothetical protein C2W64_04470 [Brevibacillus laterosporus]|nr:hypothetical protein C2W64_04470 [Brevibacillus laterosporus]
MATTCVAKVSPSKGNIKRIHKNTSQAGHTITLGIRRFLLSVRQSTPSKAPHNQLTNSSMSAPAIIIVYQFHWSIIITRRLTLLFISLIYILSLLTRTKKLPDKSGSFLCYHYLI